MKNLPLKKQLSEKMLSPFVRFAEIEASSGMLLLFCTFVALLWANSPWAHFYHQLWETPLIVGAGSAVFSKPLILWINDGLMAIFFFLVGLEIKREILIGELASLKKAALPIFAALGGMILPALFYLIFNKGGEGASGWGIPMATDIAFALGVLTLLGKRVPLSLKVFLMALAIIDDLGAVLVIAVFYTSHISWFHLAVGAGFFALLLAANLSGARHPLIYAILGIAGLWLAFLLSGVHPTIAGVLAAFMIPASTRIDAQEFLRKEQSLMQAFAKQSGRDASLNMNQDQQTLLHDLEKAAEQVQSPLQRLEHFLQPWVNYFIMPVFALANAGVSLDGGSLKELGNHPVMMGILLGLILGKPLGIVFFSWLAVKLRWALLPQGVSWRQMLGVGILGGIGFTMSLFIAGLAFENSEILSVAKLGILSASAIAGVGGWFYLRLSPK